MYECECVQSVSAQVGLGECRVSDLAVWATGRSLGRLGLREGTLSPELRFPHPPHSYLFPPRFPKHKSRQIKVRTHSGVLEAGKHRSVVDYQAPSIWATRSSLLGQVTHDLQPQVSSQRDTGESGAQGPSRRR